MTLESIVLSGRVYKYYNPSSYEEYKLLKARIKSIKAKIKGCEHPDGRYYGKITTKGHSHYRDYPELLKHLESILNK